MSFMDKLEAKKGLIGETIVDNLIKSKGYIPYMPISEGAHIFDRLVCNIGGDHIFIAEVKSKSMRVKYPDTGIDIKHYKKYKKIHEKHNIKIVIFFVDEEAMLIYGNTLDELMKPCVLKYNCCNKIGKSYPFESFGVIYFPVENMKIYAEIGKSDLDMLKKYTTKNIIYSNV